MTMGLEAQPINGNQQAAGAASPSPAPASTQAATPPAPVATPPVPAAAPPPAPLATADRTPTRKLLDGDSADIPDDADVFEISRTNFKKRLQRATSSQLKQAFGTDNVEEILAWKQQNEEFKKREEEQRLAQMTDAERFRTQFEKEQQQSAYWKQQFEQLQETHLLREQDRQVSGLLARHVDPDCLDFVAQQLAQHLHSVDEEELRDPQAYIGSWVEKYVKEHPKYGIEFGRQVAPTAASTQAPGLPPGVHQVQIPGQQQTPAPRQVPIHNGPGVAGRPQGAVHTNGTKTAAPGLPNSMSEAELREWKRVNGHNW